MFAVGSSLSNLRQSGTLGQPEDENHIFENPENSLTSSAESNDDSSVYHDVLSESDGDGAAVSIDDDRESCGGTIIASLSSRDVIRRNIEESRILAQPSESARLHMARSLKDAQLPLNEVATIQSDVLSFTPTMAELALSTHVPSQPSGSSRCRSTRSASHYDTPQSEATALSTLGIRDVQPERVACPFCCREKDLQWRLSKEREQSNDLKISGYRTSFVLVATFVCFAVAVFSFFLGKLVSDLQSEKVISQYMAQCSEMMSQREEEELYWKLVTAAFSAMVNAMAGPVANFVFNGGKR